MEVAEEGAQFMTHFGHETYYFCSKGCQEKFELEEGILREGADKGFFKRTIGRLLKEPKEKPPKCH